MFAYRTKRWYQSTRPDISKHLGPIKLLKTGCRVMVSPWLEGTLSFPFTACFNTQRGLRLFGQRLVALSETRVLDFFHHRNLLQKESCTIMKKRRKGE